jgi:hypothetical protein
MPAEGAERESVEASTAVVVQSQASVPTGVADTATRILLLQRQIGNRAVARMVAAERRPWQRRLNRQGTAETTTPPVDKRAGSLVDYIVINRTDGHAVFTMVGGEPITGVVWTDLKPGAYSVKADYQHVQYSVGGPTMRWVFDPGQVPSGVRFDVSLDGALPETLVYPDSVPVIVTAGATRGELQATIKMVSALLQTEYAGGNYDANFKEACGVLSSLNTADLTDVLKALDARFLQNLLIHFNEALKDGLVDERLLTLLQSIEYEQAPSTTKYEDKFYVDNFSSWAIDPSSFGRPNPEREKAGKWNIKLIFQYGNLTPERAIVVYADDILDADVKPPAFNHQGEWGLLYPAAFTKGTVPRMWAVKKKAIDQIEEGNYQFILTSYAASQAVLDLVLLGSGMLTRTIPAATTGRISSGLAARGGPFGTGGRMPQEMYPYVNRNPRASAEEIRLGTFLDQQAQTRKLPDVVRVVGAAESKTPGVRSGDYRFIGFDGGETSADALQPTTGRADNVYSSIMGKTTQAKVVVVELGAGNSGQISDADALATARAAVHDSSRLQRVIFVRSGQVIVDVPRTP